jgi:hypothetical protein
MKKKKQNIYSALTEILETSGIKINSKENFNSLLNKAYDEISYQDHRKYGIRVENMFAYVAGALGKCTLIKQEDGSGLCLTENQNIKIPDFKIILKTNEMFFVEVKNCAKEKIVFTKNYIELLDKYANLHGNLLKIAIYWSNIKIWTLISPSWFIFFNQRCEITFDHALAMSEMTKLNDRMIGTKAPLKLRLVANKEKTSEIGEDGQCMFTISDTQLYCSNNLILDKIEKDIAFQLIMSGKWQEEYSAHIEENKICYMDYKYTPVEINHEQGFNLIAYLSSIISGRYDSTTILNGQVERLSPHQEPEQFEIFIPENYKGKVLPLWQFFIQPNYDYKK